MTKRQKTEQTRRVVVLALPGSFSLDVLGPFEIFHGTSRLLALRTGPGPVDLSRPKPSAEREFAYDVELVGADQGQVPTASGTLLFATRALAQVEPPVDTLIVAGGDVRRLMQTVFERPQLKLELCRVAKLARRVTSVCTGSFLLAAAGLLEGKRATTHWAACDLLQGSFPNVRVEREPIYTQDGNVYTSAGATTGMDLALALVREDHGRELAQEIARWLVLYVQRPASQAQLSVPLRTQEADREPLRDLQAWIREHPHADLSVGALAERVAMSVRNFARSFRREVGMTPAAYVETVRVETAQRKLELGRASIEEIAVEVGFGSVETLRRAFTRQLGAPPSACRVRSSEAD